MHDGWPGSSSSSGVSGQLQQLVLATVLAGRAAARRSMGAACSAVALAKLAHRCSTTSGT